MMFLTAACSLTGTYSPILGENGVLIAFDIVFPSVYQVNPYYLKQTS